MVDGDRRARGLDTFEKVVGFRPPPVSGDPFLDATIDHLFAEVWARPGLSIRDRRLVTLTLLMALGLEQHMRLHIGAAMKSGDLSDAEIDELVVHVAHYGGWPGAASASQVVRALRAERDKAKAGAGG